MSASKRMAYINSNPQMISEIIEHIKEHGIEAGGECPCPDCEGKLQTKMISYIDPDPQPWKKVEFEVFACKKCGYQVRYKEGDD